MITKPTWACDCCGEERSEIKNNPWKQLTVSIARHNGKSLFDETVEICPTCQGKLLKQIESFLGKTA